MEDLFAFIGNALGEGIRLIVDLLSGLFTHADDAVDGLLNGLSGSLGISPSLLSLAILVLGLWMLWRGLRALMQRALIATLFWWLLGLLVLGWLIN